MTLRKVVLTYDESTNDVFDSDNNFIVNWILDKRHYVEEKPVANTQEDIKGLVSSGISVDDIIKLKNAGLL